MGLGLVGSGGVQGLQEGLRRRLIERALAQRQVQETAMQQQRMELERRSANRADIALDQNDQFRRDQQAALETQRADVNAERELTGTRSLNEAIPAGRYPANAETTPIMGRLVKIGAATPVDERPRVDEGPLLPGDTGADLPAGYEKRASVGQQAASDLAAAKVEAARLAAENRTTELSENAKNRMAQIQAAQAAAAGVRAGRDAQANDARTQGRVDRMSRGFDQLPLVKTTQKMSEAVAFANSLDPHTKNPGDDQALIYAFAKAMDPDSVVREGEYATVQKYAQSWAESQGFNAARIFSNTTFLTPDARKNMKATIQQKFKAGKAQYDAARESYTGRINRATGREDGGDDLTDYGAAFPKDAAPAGAGSGAPKVGTTKTFPNGSTATWDGQGWVKH
jgi:hypothetical protein